MNLEIRSKQICAQPLRRTFPKVAEKEKGGEGGEGGNQKTFPRKKANNEMRQSSANQQKGLSGSGGSGSFWQSSAKSPDSENNTLTFHSSGKHTNETNISSSCLNSNSADLFPSLQRSKHLISVCEFGNDVDFGRFVSLSPASPPSQKGKYARSRSRSKTVSSQNEENNSKFV